MIKKLQKKTLNARISKLCFLTHLFYLLLQFLSNLNEIFCACSTNVELKYQTTEFFYVNQEGSGNGFSRFFIYRFEIFIVAKRKVIGKKARLKILPKNSRIYGESLKTIDRTTYD